MSIWRTVLSLRRPYTCLVLQRIEVCLREQCRHFHRCLGDQFISKDTSQERKKARLAVERELVKDDPKGVITVPKIDLKASLPTRETPGMLIDGVRFDQLPIIHLRATKNNTIASCDKYDGGGITQVSCGLIGFKNCKKGTSVAAQAVGSALGEKLLRRGVTNVRVLMKGVGVGRMNCLKGLEMSGVNIISITDDNPIFTGKRPKKPRRL